MSELTNIHARAAKDLTTPNNLPADPNALDQVKLVAGNFPPGYAGNEALTIGMVKEITAHGREAELEDVLQKITQEETRAKAVENSLSQNKAEKTYVDSELAAQNTKVNSHLTNQTQTVNAALSQLSTAANKFYPTLAAANADIANIQVDQPVTIGESANGGLWYKATAGATGLTKSPHDPVNQAKNYADANPFFNPVLLTDQDNVNSLEEGIYYVRSAAFATAVGAPIPEAGHLISTKSSTGVYVGQTYISASGQTFHRYRNSGTWSAWSGKINRNLSNTDNLNNLLNPGTYFSGSGGAATAANNHPFVGVGCIVIVENFGTYVRQQVLSQIGSAQRSAQLIDNSYTWSSWSGVSFPSGITNLNNLAYKGENISRRISSMSALNGHLDNAVTSGSWQTIVTSIATTENGFPITGTLGLLEVSSNGNQFITQTWQTYKGTAYRYGSYNSQSVLTWQPWRGYINSDNGLTDISNALVVGQSPIKRISALSEIGTHLDDVKTSGMWHTTLRSIATTENGFPITDVIGVIEVSGVSGAQAVTQYWRSYKGLAVRWGSHNAQGDLTWQPWQGVEYNKNGLIDLGVLEDKVADLQANSNSHQVIYGWGSSTLELAGSYFTAMAERHNHVYVDHGVSGETLAVSGMQQGSNIVTLKFADSTLINNTNHAVTITQSFKPKRGRSYKEVELSNGVKGLLYFSENTTNANTFKPTNLTEPLAVDTTYEYRAINPQFINQGKGLYYFDIGKNNMGYADTAQDIVDAQQEMIDYIPEGSEYLVGGHFVNTGTSGSAHANKVEAVNQILKLRYGLRFCDYYDFLYDDAVWAKYGITKTAEDIAAIAVGELPPSLGRDIGTETRDPSHLRDEMSAEIALQAEARFIKLGYFS